MILAPSGRTAELNRPCQEPRNEGATYWERKNAPGWPSRSSRSVSKQDQADQPSPADGSRAPDGQQRGFTWKQCVESLLS